MAKQSFIGYLPPPTVWKAKDVSLDAGLMLVQFNPRSDVVERLRKEFVKVNSKNDERFEHGKDEIELEVTIDIHYAKRSVDQNSLIWALNTIRAEVLNRESPSTEPWTAQKIHSNDMEELAPKNIVRCTSDIKDCVLQVLQTEKGVVKSVNQISENEWAFEVWQTTRFWNSKMANEYITSQIDELASMHVTTYNDGNLDILFKEIEQWRKKQNLTS